MNDLAAYYSSCTCSRRGRSHEDDRVSPGYKGALPSGSSCVKRGLSFRFVVLGLIALADRCDKGRWYTLWNIRPYRACDDRISKCSVELNPPRETRSQCVPLSLKLIAAVEALCVGIELQRWNSVSVKNILRYRSKESVGRACTRGLMPSFTR